MWFKNAKIFRLSPNFSLSAEDIEQALSKQKFQPGCRSGLINMGWVAPVASSGLVHAIDGQYLIQLRIETKLLPASVINHAVMEKVKEVQEQQGYKPGRKQTKEIKELITETLLPKAFSVFRDTRAWLDTKNRWLIIDAASAAKSDEVIGMLAKVLDPLPIQSLFTERRPSEAMTEWLLQDEAPANFTIDQEVDLVSSAENSATVRFIKQQPDHADASKHIQNGKVCAKLAMTWADRISFILDETLSIKRIKPLSLVKEQSFLDNRDDQERFDSDMVLMCAELASLLDELVTGLGGELIQNA